MRKKDEFHTQHKTHHAEQVKSAKIERVDDTRFTRDLDALIEQAEEMRLKRMKQHRTRSFIAMTLNVISLTLGVGGFGWFLLMQAAPMQALASIAIAFFIPTFMHFWTKIPLEAYARDHKTIFMPKLAKAIAGLDFHASRGVSAKILERLAVIPPHDSYKAEDCFMGTYKGVKVILSEARLYSRHHTEGIVFDGLFVLLENDQEVFEGHTIITANHKMAKASQKTRWKKLEKVHISVDNPEWDIFEIYSTKPDSAELFVGEKLIKELAEAAQVFDNAPLTAVLFGRKYVFLMIPYAKDMFEASDIFVPFTTTQHALACKKEIEQLLEIVDVFDLYKPLDS